MWNWISHFESEKQFTRERVSAVVSGLAGSTSDREHRETPALMDEL